MTPRIRLLVVIATLATVGLPVLAQEESVAVFKSSVDLVSMAAIVRDGRGRIVKSLRRDDFEVFDAGQRRPVLELRTESGAPASVALLVDGSGSMKVGLASDAALRISSGILASLKPERDDAALFSFDTRLLSVQDFTHDLKVVNERLSIVESWGSTSLFDAIAGTSAIVAKRTSNRRAVVVLTDGADTFSTYSPAQVAAIASAIDVPVYVFVMSTGTPDGDKLPVDVERRSALASLAQATGGEFFLARDAASTTAAIKQMVEELQHQYVLAFAASSEHGWRSIQVRTRQKGLQVRSRAWYLSGAAAGE